MSDELHDLYQEIILHHNKHPRHYGAMADATHRAEGYNPLCGDRIEVFLRIEEGYIAAIQFEAASCAICKASGSMMTAALAGESVPAAAAIAAEVAGILNVDIPTINLETSGDLAALAGVRNFPARIKCASLPWHTYRAALQGEQKTEVT